MHGRGVNHPGRRHLAGARRHRLAEPDRGQLVALALNDPPAGAGDRARDAAPVLQGRIRGIGDRVDVELRDVSLLNFDLRHLRAEPILARHARRRKYRRLTTT